MRYLGFLLGISAVLFVMAGCGISRGYQEKQFLAMDTLISVALSGTEEDVQQIQTIINELENKVSTTNQSSELYKSPGRGTVFHERTVRRRRRDRLPRSGFWFSDRL